MEAPSGPRRSQIPGLYCWFNLLSPLTFLLTPVFFTDTKLLKFFTHNQFASVVITSSNALRRKHVVLVNTFSYSASSSLATSALPLGWAVNDFIQLISTHVSWHKAEHLAQVNQSESTVSQVKQLLVTGNLIQPGPMSVNLRAFAGTIRERESLSFDINICKTNKIPHGNPAQGKANTDGSRAQDRQEPSPDLPAQLSLRDATTTFDSSVTQSHELPLVLFVCSACYYMNWVSGARHQEFCPTQSSA